MDVPLTASSDLSLTLGSDVHEYITVDLQNFAQGIMDKCFCFGCLIVHVDFIHVEQLTHQSVRHPLIEFLKEVKEGVTSPLVHSATSYVLQRVSLYVLIMHCACSSKMPGT